MPDPIPSSILAAAETAGNDAVRGTPWSLGVRCDGPGCTANFEGDFLVPENSTRGERLRIVLDWVEAHGWRVDWQRPIWASLTYCSPCAGASPVTPAGCPESHMDDGSHAIDYEDSGRCVWCGEANPDWAGRGTAEGP